MQRARIPIRNSLSYRQTRNTVIVAFSIGLILSSAQIYLDYFSQRNELRESVKNVLSTANRAAYHAAFNLDESGARQITRGLVSNQPIIEATIKDNFGQILGAAENTENQDVSLASRWLFGEPRTVSRQLSNEAEYDRPVGELIVVIDPSLNAATFVQRSKVVVLSGILRNFILALCIITVFYYTITRSILQASLPIQQGITDKRIPPPKNHSEDEIGVLIGAFNDHLAIIEQQHEQIVDSNVNLEKLVAQRTAQLGDKNRELDKERQSALQASQAKSDFLAMMSHEIRTPMNGILGMADLLSRNPDSPQQKEYVDAILDSSKSLLSLMNSVLDYSKYEQGKLSFESIPFDLSRLVNGIVFLLTASAEKKQILLSSRIDEEVPGFVIGDPEKLRQVLLNLLTNAIKFTDEGEVSVVVSLAPNGTVSRGQQARVRFEVTDTGIGIAESARSTIFEAFTQADSSTSRRYGGTGMGLAICDQIVKQQGGDIGFNSAENQGSSFWFELAFTVSGQAAQTEVPVAAITLPGEAVLNILVVDDVPINRKLLEGQLSCEQHRVALASNGREALQQLCDRDIDLILMDLHMPEMDGLEATRRIRAMDNPQKSQVPIIGITANISTDGTQACTDSGMNLVITKPTDMQKLLDSIARVMGSPSPGLLETVRSSDTGYVDFELMHQHREALGEEQVTALYREAIESAKLRVANISHSTDQDLRYTEEQAHALAGLCSNFGFIELGQLASRIEHAAASGQADQTRDEISHIDELAEKTIGKLGIS